MPEVLSALAAKGVRILILERTNIVGYSMASSGAATNGTRNFKAVDLDLQDVDRIGLERRQRYRALMAFLGRQRRHYLRVTYEGLTQEIGGALWRAHWEATFKWVANVTLAFPGGHEKLGETGSSWHFTQTAGTQFHHRRPVDYIRTLTNGGLRCKVHDDTGGGHACLVGLRVVQSCMMLAMCLPQSPIWH